jgi:hypothetical protein
MRKRDKQTDTIAEDRLSLNGVALLRMPFSWMNLSDCHNPAIQTGDERSDDVADVPLIHPVMTRERNDSCPMRAKTTRARLRRIVQCGKPGSYFTARAFQSAMQLNRANCDIIQPIQSP